MVAMNRLSHEKSPYLLQHARNPVDWFPWGPEAFAKARTEGKPIFLSIGYSSCHWCHVMERESFENEAIARILNAHFVSIKVDREERPDVDRVYMTFVQATTGGGGWPLNVWLTPDLQPFYGGTYFPPDDRWGRPGLKALLSQIADVWDKDRKRLAESGEAFIRRLNQAVAGQNEAGANLGPALPDQAYREFEASYDSRYGGFGGAPKFPRPVTLHFLFRYHDQAGRDTPSGRNALNMALFTLRKMAEGGMHDHLGGGFHRYAVDESWQVPHFEKMLYDQAQLACAYLDAYQITHDRFFADTARDILDYVERDMTGENGAFYSAEDADSPKPENPGEHAEGAFYVWEHAEIVDALGPDAALFCYVYGVAAKGNAPADPQGEFENKNILIVRHTTEEAAAAFGKSANEVRDSLAGSRARLFSIRAKRPRPHRDDKVITSWNGLMISAFARAAQVLNEPRYAARAEAAARFIAANLVNPEAGTLLRRHRAGQSAIDGYADDYACLIQGLLDLVETTFDGAHLKWAVSLQNTQNDLFRDEQHGGYFSTTGRDPSILLRLKEDYDGAEPSANSVAVLNLARLARMTDNAAFGTMADQALRAFQDRIGQTPSAMPQMLAAAIFRHARPLQIVLAGDPVASDTKAMLREIRARFIPNKIVLLADGGAGQEQLAEFQDFVKSVRRTAGKATAYVCENFVCKQPVHDPDTLAALLDPWIK